MHSQGNATGGEKIWPALAGAPFNHFCSVNGLLLQGPVVKGSNPGEDPEVAVRLEMSLWSPCLYGGTSCLRRH